MFNNDLVIKDSADADKTFSLISVAGGKSIRKMTGLTDAEKVVTLSHQKVTRGKDQDGVVIEADRHLMRYDHSIIDANGITRTLTAYSVLEVPKGTAFDLTAKKDATNLVWSVLHAGATWAGLTKILNSEP